MSEKRRDNRNRILHVGESQRQDGRYAYKYFCRQQYATKGNERTRFAKTAKSEKA